MLSYAIEVLEGRSGQHSHFNLQTFYAAYDLNSEKLIANLKVRTITGSFRLA